MTTASAEDVSIRNVAIIAHVDHGKTTLVDHMLRQSGLFHENETVDERVMDTMEQEQERGITIASKNASLNYRGTQINLVDTPGHSDFGGEVERIMNMVDGAILLVDAGEGPQPQTRFVVQKALEQDLSIVLCVNKIDRDDARVSEVVDEVFELFMELGANDEQLDFPIVYSAAINGMAVADPEDHADDLSVLFDSITETVPPPQVDLDSPLQMLVSDLGHSDYLGRLAIGRIRQGRVATGDQVLLDRGDETVEGEVSGLFGYEGLEQTSIEEAKAGDICALAGFEHVQIGDSVTSIDRPSPASRIKVEEPNVAISIGVNDGPFSGHEGEHVTGTKLHERLRHEQRNNVAIQLEDTGQTEWWSLRGRGELQLSIILEDMRRDGYEMVVSKPEVLTREENGETLEPVENVVIDVPEEYVGSVTEKLGERGGTMQTYENISSDRVRLEFHIPTRGLIGYRSEFQTDTRGTGLLYSNITGYEPMSDQITRRHTGALVADRQGESTAYALEKLEDRGRLFIQPGDRCYEGMIVGEHSREPNLDVNVTKQKQLTNFRAAGSDDAIDLEPVEPMTIEDGLEWIEDDELIEITPDTVRLRCRQLDPNNRDS